MVLNKENPDALTSLLYIALVLLLLLVYIQHSQTE
jgi:hypothetical protein